MGTYLKFLSIPIYSYSHHSPTYLKFLSHLIFFFFNHILSKKIIFNLVNGGFALSSRSIVIHCNSLQSSVIHYLILVSTASTGGGGLFYSRRTFFHREHGRYCFRKVYLENITHKIPYTPNKKLSTPTKKPSMPTKIPSIQN